jgi:hypothetical protein
MRLMILWTGLTAVAVLLLRFLLDPFNGEVVGAFLSTGLVIAGILSFVELWRIMGNEFEVDRVLLPAQTSYWLALLQLTPVIAHLMVPAATSVAPWLRLAAYLVIFLTVGALLFSCSYLLCRISFRAEEMRASFRRRRERAQRTVVQ